MDVARFFTVGLCLILSAVPVNAQETSRPVWEKISDEGVRGPVTVLTRYGDSGIVAAAPYDVYVSSEDGSFNRLAGMNRAGAAVHDMSCDTGSGVCWLATAEGVLQIDTVKATSERIFYSSDEQARDCRAVIGISEDVYVGTSKEVFRRKTNEKVWRPVLRSLSAQLVDVQSDAQYVYVVMRDRVIILHPESDARTELPFPPGLGRGDDEESSRERPVFRVTAPDSYLLGLAGKVYSWTPVHQWTPIRQSSGTLGAIQDVVPLPDGDALPSADLRLLVATDRGVFLSAAGRWESLRQGLASRSVNDLLVGSHGRVWAATDNGLYFLNAEELRRFPGHPEDTVAPYDSPDLTRMFQNEPSIRDVQRWAIAYADVHPDKIERWRRQARIRAWIPDIDIGVDGGAGWSRSDSLWGTSSSGGTHYSGPDDKSSSEDLGWDISLSWDLADAVWSTDQTSIDNRGKLMVELRDDILNQITRLYFERRRLQLELTDTAMISTDRQDRELRIAELTALIDALTDGEFSRRVEDRRENIDQ